MLPLMVRGFGLGQTEKLVERRAQQLLLRASGSFCLLAKCLLSLGTKAQVESHVMMVPRMVRALVPLSGGLARKGLGALVEGVANVRGFRIKGSGTVNSMAAGANRATRR